MSETFTEIVRTAERAVTGSEVEMSTLVRLLDGTDLAASGEPEERAYLAVLLNWLGMRNEAMLALSSAGGELGDQGAGNPNLAGMLASGHGDYERARELFERALAEGADTSLRAKILANLAALSLLNDEVGPASAWLAQAIDAGRQASDPATDILSASIEFGIARVQNDVPGLREAVSRLNEATRASLTELGSDHPLSLTAVASLAAAEFELAAAEESVENQERAVAVLEVVAHRLAADLGADHPQALACLEDLCVADLVLALASGRMDRATRAASALESVSQRVAAAVGEGHPQARTAAANAASARLNLEEALAGGIAAVSSPGGFGLMDVNNQLQRWRVASAMARRELADRSRTSEQDDLDARVMAGRYRLVERLGQGSMGSVWKAYDTRLDRIVAVKELVPDRDGNDDLGVRRERVRREALALARVEHPAIVSIHDLFYEGPSRNPWIVMAYANGRSLDSLIKETQPLDERKVADIGLKVLEGLMACHKRDVYHRDVKPANIVLSDDGAVHLVDFGIARIAGKNPLTVEGKVIGTPEYMAPELLTDHQPDPATDLWALGVTLYCALEGRSPFQAETLHTTITAILSKNPPEPRTRGEVAAIVLAMLRKHPAERPDAAAVATVLRRVANGDQDTQPIHAGLTAQSRHPAALAERTEPPPAAAQPERSSQRPTSLQGRDVLAAAQIVSGWPTNRAVTDLLALGETTAAGIINRCDDLVAGKLLSGIAAENPAQARKILEIVTTKQAGRLLDHMNSPAAASALSLLTPTGAVRVLAQADDLTATGVLLEMNAQQAARLVATMNTDRAGKLLSQVAPVTVAAILRNMPAGQRQVLLNRLPEPFRSPVTWYL